MERTELEELGEFGLIELLTKDIVLYQKTTLKGVGDDAAVIKRGKELEVVSTDLLVEGIHFDLSYTPLKHLGYKAVAVNLSDIAAMNAAPTHITVSIAVSNRFSREALTEIYEGINAACERYQVDLIGGDTTSSLSGMVISIAALGTVSEKEVAYRSGAKDTELLCVSGDLGAAYIGLQILEREKQIWKENPDIQPDLSGHDYVLQRILKPEPRIDVVEELKKKKIIPTAMIDVSDGLASEIFHLCKQSNTGVRVYEDKIPIDPTVSSRAAEFNLEPTICALNGGEDYELLFTVKQSDYDTVSSIEGISIIGHMTDADAGKSIVYANGQEISMKAQGWKSF